MLDTTDQHALVRLARQALDAGVGRTKAPSTDMLLEAPNHGAFVTIYSKAHVLRGCIGTFSGGTPLAATVARMAVAAALEDPRFAPVTIDELPVLTLELSLLSPTTRCRAQDIIVGEHGVTLERGFLRSVFLPKVATEQGWSRTELLQHLARKANLPPEAWAWADTVLTTFTAEVFGES